MENTLVWKIFNLLYHNLDDFISLKLLFSLITSQSYSDLGFILYSYSKL